MLVDLREVDMLFGIVLSELLLVDEMPQEFKRVVYSLIWDIPLSDTRRQILGIGGHHAHYL